MIARDNAPRELYVVVKKGLKSLVERTLSYVPNTRRVGVGEYANKDSREKGLNNGGARSLAEG